MSDFINFYDWACWRFSPFEYRLCGYIQQGNQARCIVTEPILGVNLEEGYVETVNNLKFKMYEPIQKANMIDMMYTLDRWMNINCKGRPGEATNMVLEQLGRITADGQKVEAEPEVKPKRGRPKKNG